MGVCVWPDGHSGDGPDWCGSHATFTAALVWLAGRGVALGEAFQRHGSWDDGELPTVRAEVVPVLAAALRARSRELPGGGEKVMAAVRGIAWVATWAARHGAALVHDE